VAIATDDLFDHTLPVEMQALQYLAETACGTSFAQRHSADYAEPMRDTENYCRTGGRRVHPSPAG